MKKSIIPKLLLILLIGILMVILKPNTCSAADIIFQDFITQVKNNPDYVPNKNMITSMGQYALEGTNYVYCIAHANMLYNSRYDYQLYAAYRIEGDVCVDLYNPSNTTKNFDNAIMAGILSSGSLGYGHYKSGYWNTQTGVYRHYNKWVNANPSFGLSNWGQGVFDKGGGAYRNWYNNIVANAANGAYTNVRVNLFIFKNITKGASSLQNLMIAVPSEVKDTGIEIVKVSSTEKDQNGNKKPLADVDFVIRRVRDGKYVSQAKKVNDAANEYVVTNFTDNGLEYEENDDRGTDVIDFKLNEALKFTTNANGKVRITGLECDTEYEIIECSVKNIEYDNNKNIGRKWKITTQDKKVLPIECENIREIKPGLKILKTYNHGTLLTDVKFTVAKLTGKNGVIEKYVSEAVEIDYEDSGLYRQRRYSKNKNDAFVFKLTPDGWFQVIDLEPGWYRVTEVENNNPGLEGQVGRTEDYQVVKDVVGTWEFNNTGPLVTQLRIKKVDAENPKKPLAGARFTIQIQKQVKVHENLRYCDGIDCEVDSHWSVRWVSTGEYITGYGKYNGEYKITTGTTAVELITDSSGYIKLIGTNFADLLKAQSGEYARRFVVKETGAPSGYIISSGEQYITEDNFKDGDINIITIKNKPDNPPDEHRGSVTIKGSVWEDEALGKEHKGNSVKDVQERGLEGIVVYWKDQNGNILDKTITDSSGNYEMTYTIRWTNHTYSLDEASKSRINNSYVEFKYNGLKYTTVQHAGTGDNTSRSIESVNERNNLNATFGEVRNEGVMKNGQLTSITSNRLNYRTEGNKATSIPVETDVTNNTLKEFHVTASTKDVAKNLLSDGGYLHHRNNKSSVCIRETSTEDGGVIHHYGNRETSWEIWNMNLGLVRREQPDATVVSDLYKVVVEMKGQRYTYYYNSRGIQTPTGVYDYKTKFTGKYNETYTRPINPADIEYIKDPENANNAEDLKVYVEYHIRAKNESETLLMKIGEIGNYYDNQYILAGSSLLNSKLEKTQDVNWKINGPKNEHVNSMSTRIFENKMLKPGEQSDILSVTFQVDNDCLKNVMNEKTTLLHNVTEINAYTTLHGADTVVEEYKKASEVGRTNQLYAGLDKDSHPGSVQFNIDTNQNGNLEVFNKDSFEDDTDMAPTFILVRDPNYKTISGTVFEDKTSVSADNGGRIGDGKLLEGEHGVQNVKVELLKVNPDGTTGEVAKIYTPKGPDLAVTTTDENGNYTFEGVVVDNYILKYTYGNDTNEASNVGLKEASKINKEYEINARNYKSTIIADKEVIPVMQGASNDKWHLTKDDGTSIAVDDLEVRKAIGELKYGTFNTGVGMTAYSRPFKVQVEYSTPSQEATEKQEKPDANGGTNIEGKEFVTEGTDATLARNPKTGTVEGKGDSNVLTGEGTDYEHNWNKFDFGIAERAREDIILNKTIGHLKITLANGQILTEGTPYEDTMNYVKALGTGLATNREDAVKAKEKFLYIEMDSELIQGARLDILYKLTVTNNSEKDYEYDYGYDYQNNITTSENAKYYYYGEVTTPEINTTVDWVVDYMDPELTCTVANKVKEIDDKKLTWEKLNVEMSRDDIQRVNEREYIYRENKFTDAEVHSRPNWIQVTSDIDENNEATKTPAEKLADKNWISKETKNTVKDNNYLVFITNYFYDVKTGESKDLELFASKLIGNQAENFTYENHTEILQLNGKIARTIDRVEKDGEQVRKTYKSGNYVPSLTRSNLVQNTTTINDNVPGRHEQDDDAITIKITPPTGLENNAIIYIATGAVGLIVLAGGIYFIRKKVI
ncbi:MAG: hypothetical protein HFJ55_06900 [Clostridia bacterium]|nr:hypothetical protein [Clostridia bacterium]